MLCAASGYADLFDLRVWPDPVLAPRNVDEQKAARWRGPPLAETNRQSLPLTGPEGRGRPLSGSFQPSATVPRYGV